MPRFQHPLEVYGFDKMIEDGLDVEDLEVKDLLILILSELRILNIHMSLVTEEEINENDEEITEV